MNCEYELDIHLNMPTKGITPGNTLGTIQVVSFLVCDVLSQKNIWDAFCAPMHTL